MNYWFKEKLCEFCECWAIAKLLISICIHRWLHLISCETFSKCYRKLWVFRCINFSLLTPSLTQSTEMLENPWKCGCQTHYVHILHPGLRGKRELAEFLAGSSLQREGRTAGCVQARTRGFLGMAQPEVDANMSQCGSGHRGLPVRSVPGAQCGGHRAWEGPPAPSAAFPQQPARSSCPCGPAQTHIWASSSSTGM